MSGRSRDSYESDLEELRRILSPLDESLTLPSSLSDSGILSRLNQAPAPAPRRRFPRAALAACAAACAVAIAVVPLIIRSAQPDRAGLTPRTQYMANSPEPSIVSEWKPSQGYTPRHEVTSRNSSELSQYALKPRGGVIFLEEGETVVVADSGRLNAFVLPSTVTGTVSGVHASGSRFTITGTDLAEDGTSSVEVVVYAIDDPAVTEEARYRLRGELVFDALALDESLLVVTNCAGAGPQQKETADYTLPEQAVSVDAAGGGFTSVNLIPLDPAAGSGSLAVIGIFDDVYLFGESAYLAQASEDGQFMVRLDFSDGSVSVTGSLRIKAAGIVAEESGGVLNAYSATKDDAELLVFDSSDFTLLRFRDLGSGCEAGYWGGKLVISTPSDLMMLNGGSAVSTGEPVAGAEWIRGGSSIYSFVSENNRSTATKVDQDGVCTRSMSLEVRASGIYPSDSWCALIDEDEGQVVFLGEDLSVRGSLDLGERIISAVAAADVLYVRSGSRITSCSPAGEVIMTLDLSHGPARD